MVNVVAQNSYTLRPHKPSDMDWVIAAHRAIPPSEFGFSKDFSRMVERILRDFVRDYDENREHCWIAEMAGESVGCVFLARRSEEVGQLRLLLVSPKARGFGIGRRLVDECINFARSVGYEKIILQTDSIAVAARRIYEKAGFRLVHSRPHQFFGRQTADEQWELPLSGLEK